MIGNFCFCLFCRKKDQDQRTNIVVISDSAQAKSSKMIQTSNYFYKEQPSLLYSLRKLIKQNALRRTDSESEITCKVIWLSATASWDT